MPRPTSRFYEFRRKPAGGYEGYRKGQWRIRINDQWRLCFEWRDGSVLNVEIVDYH